MKRGDLNQVIIIDFWNLKPNNKTKIIIDIFERALPKGMTKINIPKR